MRGPQIISAASVRVGFVPQSDRAPRPRRTKASPNAFSPLVAGGSRCWFCLLGIIQ